MTAYAAPPAPGPPRRAALPLAVERTLPSGLRTIAFTQSTGPKSAAVPLIAAQLVVFGGSAAESGAQAGLSALAAALLTQGTTSRGAREIAQQVDALGARLDATSGYDAAVVSVSAATPVFPQAFALFADVVRHPAFAPAEVDRVRTKSIGDLALTYSNPSALARLVANRVAFGATPYGHPLAGTAQTLGALGRADVARFHERFYRPDNAVLVLGGDIAPADAFALAQRMFGDWQAPSEALEAPAAFPPPPPRPVLVAVDKPDAGRTAVVAGRVAIARASPEFAAGTVATAVLAGYSGRLNQEIRVKRGLSYGASAQLATRRLAGLFVASTLVDHARAAETVGVVQAALAGLAAAPVEPAELATRKASVTGGFYRGVETVDGIAAALAELALHGLPLGDIAAYVPRIEAVTADDVRYFARRSVSGDTFVVLAGNARVFAAAVRAAHPQLQIVPFERLDLNAADPAAP